MTNLIDDDFLSENKPISKSNPFPCLIKERYCLNKNSSKTFHVSLDTCGKNFGFDEGDSVGIFPENDPTVVSEYLEMLTASKDLLVTSLRTQEQMSFETFLFQKANLLRSNTNLIKKALEYSQDDQIKKHLLSLLDDEKKETLHEYIQHHEPLEIIRSLKAFSIPAQELCNVLSPLLPRFYSIASSAKKFPNEIHLTVALSSHEHKGKIRHGVASYFLCHAANIGKTKVPCFIQKSAHFHLPADDALPMIMVGPGTGIAPYKAFMEERVYRKAKGKNWLFFGERHKDSDFFYQDFWESLEKEGIVKLTTAFSRDQEEKIYVQHRLYEHKKEVWKWLNEGSLFYVCGSANPMAKDVEAVIQQIIEEEGKMSELEAREYLKEMRKHKRYLADVY